MSIPPSPPTAASALTAAQADQTALQNAANAAFIAQSIIVINQAIANGKQVAYMTTFQHCNINTLATYFNNLGYSIIFPAYAPLNGAQPAELFGPSWIAYWQNQLIPTGLIPRNPIRMGIVWAPPGTPLVFPPYGPYEGDAFGEYGY